MKALNYKIKTLLTLFILAGTCLYANEQTKDLHKEFKTNKSTVLIVDGKFCDLTIQNWEKDQAVVDVTIKSNHSDESKAKKILNMIDIKIEQDGNKIIIETFFDEDFNKIESAIGKKFSINIVVNAPSYIGIELENKFCSNKLGSFSGNFDLRTSFGHTEIEQLSGPEVSIEVSQGDFSIGKISNADIKMNFGAMNIQNAENLNLEINQGEVKLGNVKNLSAEVTMGSCIVSVVDPSFESIDIDLNTGNVVLGIDKNAGFSINAEMKMGNLDLPLVIGMVEKGKHGMSASFEGKYGNGKSTISLEGNLGNIEVKLK